MKHDEEALGGTQAGGVVEFCNDRNVGVRMGVIEWRETMKGVGDSDIRICFAGIDRTLLFGAAWPRGPRERKWFSAF